MDLSAASLPPGLHTVIKLYRMAKFGRQMGNANQEHGFPSSRTGRIRYSPDETLRNALFVRNGPHDWKKVAEVFEALYADAGIEGFSRDHRWLMEIGHEEGPAAAGVIGEGFFE